MIYDDGTDEALAMAVTPPSTNGVPDRPDTGEKSRPQTSGDVASGIFAPPSFGNAPAANLSTYRRMLSNPTIAIGRMAVEAPIKASEWSVETDDDAPEGAEELIDESVVRSRSVLVAESLRALYFRSQSFELIYETDGRSLFIDKYKPLRQEMTKVLVDKETGAFNGLKQGEVELQPEKVFHFYRDAEPGEYQGRSLLENIRETAWWPWVQTIKREGQQTTKTAGVTVAAEYPMGKGRDANGAEVDNFDLAQKLINSIGRGNGVAVPRQLIDGAEELLRLGAKFDDVKKWAINFLEPGTGHVDEMLSAAKHKEALMLRGMMVPERAITEGQFGTKAESEAQAGFVMAFASEVLGDIVRCVNWYIVDRLLAWNFGPEARGTVRVVSEPIIDAKAAFVRKIVSEVLTNPANADLWETLTDIDAQIEMTGLPQPPEPRSVEVRPRGDPAEASNGPETIRALQDGPMPPGGETPPKGVRDEAAKGLRWRRQYARGGEGTALARGLQLSSESAVSMDAVRRMADYFRSHESDKEAPGFRPGEDGFPNGKRIAWALHGGDAGRRWAEKVLRNAGATQNQ